MATENLIRPSDTEPLDIPRLRKGKPVMTSSTMAYSNVVIKQRVEAWAEGLDFDPDEQILMVLEDKCGSLKLTVVDAHPEGDCLMLTIAADLWEQPREFALLKSGSLAW